MIALMGLFMLVACSEDAYQEADKMNENGSVENNSGGMQTNSIDPTIPYESPYEIGNAGTPIHYAIHNLSEFELNITPYVGLAYFDGIDDGWYNLTPTPINLNNGNYPNIYNGMEYLNMIECAPMFLGAMSHLDDGPLYHCPTVNPNAVYCDVVGGGGTIDEADLLQDFGKIYYYRLDMIDPTTQTVIFSDTFRLDFNVPTPGAPWNNMGINSMFFDDLYAHFTTNEIITAFTTTQSETFFTFGGNNYHIHFFSSAESVIFSIEP